ncbi:acyltransferase family protein [Janibacter sp. GS2]|uniref:acyltransferase family protein n=1 Tax=Janibacter sp. GS2 TaxID=3442646 RepID=UPI003EBF3FE6
MDALRAIAALAVFFSHIVGYWQLTDLPLRLPELLSLGAQGVDLFIVMSGFVLALPAFHAHRQLRNRNFLARRAIRLLPSYYVALAFASVIALSPAATWIVAERARPGDVAWHVVLLQTWNPERLGAINGSLWSVALEAQLYLTFPFLIFVCRRWGWVPLVVTTASVSILLTHFDLPGFLGAALTDEHNLPVRLVQFSAGLACAWIVTHQQVPDRRLLWPMALASGFLAVAWTTADLETGRAVVWALPCAALILLVSGSAGGRLSITPLERWGLASYSFYLLHQPIVLIVGHLLRPQVPHDVAALLVGTAIALPTTALAAWLLYVVVERPSHRYGKRHFSIFAAESVSSNAPPRP